MRGPLHISAATIQTQKFRPRNLRIKRSKNTTSNYSINALPLPCAIFHPPIFAMAHWFRTNERNGQLRLSREGVHL